MIFVSSTLEERRIGRVHRGLSRIETSHHHAKEKARDDRSTPEWRHLWQLLA